MTDVFKKNVKNDHHSLWTEGWSQNLHWSAGGVFDENTWEDWQADGSMQGSEWLESLAKIYLSDTIVSECGWSNGMASESLARNWMALFPDDFASLFLDSFSVVENGEEARRYDREIHASPLQSAILDVVSKHGQALREMLSPREFEVVVAHALRECGFDRVTLKRYTKDGGADIVAVVSNGTQEDTALIEVKHGARVTGVEVIDRLNGARDRMAADRALLVTSGHISRDARRAYGAKRSIVAAYTFQELLSFMRDCPGWKRTPLGLWTKDA